MGEKLARVGGLLLGSHTVRWGFNREQEEGWGTLFFFVHRGFYYWGVG